MPKAGGEHVYSYRALGRNASFLCTWAILLAYASVVTFEAVALPTVVEYLIPDFSRGYLWTVAGWDVNASWVAVGAGAGLVMTAINVIGIKTAARIQMLVTMLILLAGATLILKYVGNFLQSTEDVTFSRENVGGEITATISDEGIYLSGGAG